MIPLPQIIRKNRYTYTLVLRGKRSCIYRQEVTETVQYYEVFRIKIKPERYLKGKLLSASEAFPHDEAFGRWAWSCRNLSDAIDRFNKLELEVRNG